MASIRFEARRLSTLAAPVIVTQLATMMLGVVDTVMVGHVSVEALGAAALGHVWTLGTMIFAMGVILGIDPIVTQAHGAADVGRLGVALQRGILVGLALSVPTGWAWLHTATVMGWLGQTPELAELARRYTVVQIPTLPLFLIFTALRQQLQGRGIVAPAMLVALVANLFNVVANWALIFGHLGLPALGIVGAGTATALTRAFMLFMLLWLVRRGRLLAGAWIPWGQRALRWKGFTEVIHFGLPVGVQLSLEVWAFQIATLLAGRLGEVQLAAHQIVLNVASLSFMVPLGIAMAAVTRVGNLLGAGERQGAQRAAWVAVGMGASVMSVSATLFVALRHQIPALFTPDVLVRGMATSVLPIAAAFQLFDGTQVVGGGVLRGMGSTRPAAIFNLVGYYLIALPLAWWLTFPLGLGLHGLWWGLALGLALVALMLVIWIWRRGPLFHRSVAAERLV
jgi:MATE family multidrug resistance protein